MLFQSCDPPQLYNPSAATTAWQGFEQEGFCSAPWQPSSWHQADGALASVAWRIYSSNQLPPTTTTSTTANLKTDCRSCVLFAPASGAPKWQARFRQAHGLYFSRGRRNSSSLDLGCVKAAVEPHLQPPLNIRNRKPELQAWRGI